MCCLFNSLWYWVRSCLHISKWTVRPADFHQFLTFRFHCPSSVNQKSWQNRAAKNMGRWDRLSTAVYECKKEGTFKGDRGLTRDWLQKDLSHCNIIFAQINDLGSFLWNLYHQPQSQNHGKLWLEETTSASPHCSKEHHPSPSHSR